MLLVRYVQAAPTWGEATEIVFGHDLLAYEVWEGTPHVVFREGRRVIFDQLKLDWISVGFPPTPRWQLTGDWYYVSETDALASVGVARCPGVRSGRCDRNMQVFGEITAPEIVVVEIQYDDAWHRYPVSYPGYLIRLDGFHGVPTAYRWLNPSGDVVWSQGRVPQLSW